MIRYAQLRPGHGFRPLQAVAYYAQRLVTLRRLRRSISQSISLIISIRHGGRSSSPPEPTVTQAVSNLLYDGLAKLDNLLRPEQVEATVDFFRGKKVFGGDGQLVAIEQLSPTTATAAYPLDAVVSCPGLLDAVNSPLILQIAARYLECKPTISSLGVRWSFPCANNREQTQFFHRDPDDWRFLKLFVYLSDVDKDAGPHVYVAGSNTTAGGLRAKTYARERLERQYGAEKIWTIHGARGTTFIADTHGIHMGMPPRATPRLLLQVQFSILPVFALLYEPVDCPAGIAVDKYINRLIIK